MYWLMRELVLRKAAKSKTAASRLKGFTFLIYTFYF
jgi:hypothetical protein